MKLINLTENVTLNFHQRHVLLQIFLADTATLAFDQTNKSEADIKAREILYRLRYIKISDNKAILTDEGRNAIIEYGLIDENGEITEAGEEILDNFRD